MHNAWRRLYTYLPKQKFQATAADLFMATTNEVDRAIQLTRNALDLAACGRVKVATVSSI